MVKYVEKISQRNTVKPEVLGLLQLFRFKHTLVYPSYSKKTKGILKPTFVSFESCILV